MFECFVAALRLGLSSFGGPIAHVGYFREKYVQQLKWLSDERFAELMALTQFLPGPGSSQLGAAIGYERNGWLGGLGAWMGFTLPSAVLMIALAAGQGTLNEWLGNGWIHGLELVAVAVVAMAVLGMRAKLCKNVLDHVIALVVAAVLFLWNLAWLQPVLIFLGGVVTALVALGKLRKEGVAASGQSPLRLWGYLAGFVGFAVLMILLFWLPIQDAGWKVQRGLFEAGSLVFGGGHVVLPLLEGNVVGEGLLSMQEFVAGYGAAQAVPGPMFSLGAYIGAAEPVAGNVVLGGLLGMLSIFLPGMILLALGMGVWKQLKDKPMIVAGLRGAATAVVGLVLAALLKLTSGGQLVGWLDLALVAVFFMLLKSKLLPVWAVVGLGVVVGCVVPV